MKKYKLLASAPDEYGILGCIADYYYCREQSYFVLDGENVFSLPQQKVLQGVRVTQKKGRYRFERLLK